MPKLRAIQEKRTELREGGFLRDFPVRKTKRGKWKSWDGALCKNCRRQGVSFDVDFCPEHYPLARAAYERRRQKMRRFPPGKTSLKSEELIMNSKFFIGVNRNLSQMETLYLNSNKNC